MAAKISVLGLILYSSQFWKNFVKLNYGEKFQTAGATKAEATVIVLYRQ
jgi:hypothetical protein